MSLIIDSKQAFKKGAVYDDGGGRPLPRAERPPAPTQEDRLIAVLAEIRAAVQMNAKLIERMPTGDSQNFGEQIVRQQELMIRMIDEIKRNSATPPVEKDARKWRFEIKRNDKGDMKEVIAIADNL